MGKKIRDQYGSVDVWIRQKNGRLYISSRRRSERRMGRRGSGGWGGGGDVWPWLLLTDDSRAGAVLGSAAAV